MSALQQLTPPAHSEPTALLLNTASNSCEACGCNLPESDLPRGQPGRGPAGPLCSGAVPCPDCSVALYCSTRCAAQARDTHHSPQMCALMRAAAASRDGGGGGAALLDGLFRGPRRAAPH